MRPKTARSCDRHGRRRRQGLDAKGLMATFDAVKKKHEDMKPEQYNKDEIYKRNLIEVCRGPACCARPKSSV